MLTFGSDADRRIKRRDVTQHERRGTLSYMLLEEQWTSERPHGMASSRKLNTSSFILILRDQSTTIKPYSAKWSQLYGSFYTIEFYPYYIIYI